MKLFWILWIVDLIVALIALYFFIIGMKDGSVSNSNGKLWAILMLTLIVLLWGSYYLKQIGKLALANTFLGVLAVPAVLFIIVMMIPILTKARWN